MYIIVIHIHYTYIYFETQVRDFENIFEVLIIISLYLNPYNTSYPNLYPKSYPSTYDIPMVVNEIFIWKRSMMKVSNKYNKG